VPEGTITLMYWLNGPCTRFNWNNVTNLFEKVETHREMNIASRKKMDNDNEQEGH